MAIYDSFIVSVIFMLYAAILLSTEYMRCHVHDAKTDSAVSQIRDLLLKVQGLQSIPCRGGVRFKSSRENLFVKTEFAVTSYTRLMRIIQISATGVFLLWLIYL